MLSEQIKKRVTFYIEGYDPRGARHYYNLYRQEAEKEAQKKGIGIDVSERVRTGERVQSCRIAYRTDHDGEMAETVTDYHFLEWDDLIRKNWKSSVLSIFGDLWFYMRIYMFTGLSRLGHSSGLDGASGFLYGMRVGRELMNRDSLSPLRSYKEAVC